MSVADADDSDQPYEAINGDLMREMQEAAQQQQQDQEQGDQK